MTAPKKEYPSRHNYRAKSLILRYKRMITDIHNFCKKVGWTDISIDDLKIKYCTECYRHRKALDYAKEQYTNACMGAESVGLTEFQMTIDAILKGENPQEYIKKANEVF